MTTTKTPAAAIDAGIVLMRMSAERDALDDRIREQVATVRALGGSWTTVGVALNVTRSAAQQRYGSPPD
jgi:hypothetical protein